MNYTKLKKTGLVLVTMMVTTTAHAYNNGSAKHACINKVTQYGSSEYYNASSVHVTDKGHHSYGVTGNLRSRRDNQTHHFSCNIRHKEVVNWKVSPSSSHKNNTAAAIGVGILALAIAAVSNKDDKKHKNDRYTDHDRGGNPFSDMKYLKHKCKQNIRHHINRDHGRVSRLRFEAAHLHHRTLKGRGYVVFKNGGERDLNYACNFDRRGFIYDGSYGYRHRR